MAALRILIAEDDPVSALVLSKFVSPYGSVQVEDNGEKAFIAFQKQFDEGAPFDVIFLDIMMPDVGGQEALSAIREYERMLDLPDEKAAKIIMVTALQDGENLYHAHRERCHEYITKPISRSTITPIFERLGYSLPLVTPTSK